MSKRREERKKKRIEEEKIERHKRFSRVFFLNKKIGETPLELLEKFQKSFRFKIWKKKQSKICQKRKNKRKGCQKISLAYAGRLDPMADGKILVLAGEACKEREKYLDLDKEYIFEILLGFKTDSGDILGIVEDEKNNILKNIKLKELKEKIKSILVKRIGRWNMKYPVFSSKPVEGKPLFLWALEKKISEIEIPKKEVQIYNLELISIKKKKIKNIRKEVFKKINLLKKVEEESKKLGEDFRREKVLKSWNRALDNHGNDIEIYLLKIKARVSSGTYIRVLSQEIAGDLGRFGLAYSIKRSKIYLEK